MEKLTDSQVQELVNAMMKHTLDMKALGKRISKLHPGSAQEVRRLFKQRWGATTIGRQRARCYALDEQLKAVSNRPLTAEDIESLRRNMMEQQVRDEVLTSGLRVE